MQTVYSKEGKSFMHNIKDILERFSNGALVTGNDVSIGMLEKVREKRKRGREKDMIESIRSTYRFTLSAHKLSECCDPKR